MYREFYEDLIYVIEKLDSTVDARKLTRAYLASILAEMILMRHQGEISKAICSFNHPSQLDPTEPKIMYLPKISGQKQWRDHLPTCDGAMSGWCNCGAFR